MLNISEESGEEEEGIQINKTISLCLGETPGIQSGPPPSEDYHSQQSQQGRSIVSVRAGRTNQDRNDPGRPETPHHIVLSDIGKL